MLNILMIISSVVMIVFFTLAVIFLMRIMAVLDKLKERPNANTSGFSKKKEVGQCRT